MRHSPFAELRAGRWDVFGTVPSSCKVWTSSMPHSRNSPRKALRLLPTRTPSGNFFARVLGVAAADHDVIGHEGLLQGRDGFHVTAERFAEAGVAKRQLAELQGDDDVLGDQRRAQAGAEAQ